MMRPPIPPAPRRKPRFELITFSDAQMASEPSLAPPAPGGGLTELVSEVAAAYFSANPVSVRDIPVVFDQITAALRSLESAPPPSASKPTTTPGRQLSAAEIRETIHPEYLISLEDGRAYRGLRRHLTGLGMSPEEYRAKWGLPSNYPMVSETYSKQRSAIARRLEFGKRR